jgi:hypothetical protein
MVGLRSSFDQAAAIIEQQKQLLTSIALLFDQELPQLREIGKDPLVFMETIVPTLPDKSIDLNKWAFFALLMNWDSALTFDTTEKYQAFLNSIIRVNSVPKSPAPGKVVYSEASSSKVPASAPGSVSSATSLFNDIPPSTAAPVPGPSSAGVDVEMEDQLGEDGAGQTSETVEASTLAETTVP